MTNKKSTIINMVVDNATVECTACESVIDVESVGSTVPAGFEEESTVGSETEPEMVVNKACVFTKVSDDPIVDVIASTLFEVNACGRYVGKTDFLLVTCSKVYSLQFGTA